MASRGNEHLLRALAEAGSAEPLLVEAIRLVVLGSGSVTVTLESLREAAVSRDSSVATAGGGRRRLAAALAALEAEGQVTLPAAATAWDATSLPRLPAWVRRVSAAPAVRRRSGPADDMLPADIRAHLPGRVLEALAGLALDQRDVEVLTAVARWLAAGGAARPVVPLRERSLQVFGDEKQLDRLLLGRLFRVGVLSLDLVRAEVVPVPFVTTWVPGRGDGEPLCVVAENHHTWMSLVRAAVASADRHHGVHVGYGAGNQFPSGVQGVTLLDPAVGSVSYFGDLDTRGLEVPARAAEVARAGGLPPVVPALGLYRRLILTGVRRTSPAVDPGAAARLTAWLGDLARPAAELLAAGVWIPQESVGTEQLAGTAPAGWI